METTFKDLNVGDHFTHANTGRLYCKTEPASTPVPFNCSYARGAHASLFDGDAVVKAL